MAPPQAAPRMSVAELLVHTIGVAQGKIAAADYTKAQPIGPADDAVNFVLLLVAITAGMHVSCMVVETTGAALGKGLGLKGGKATRFAASFLELFYYSLSLSLGFVIFRQNTWLWPEGWQDVMSDGRVQTIKGLAPYHVAAETKYLYIMETSWVVSGFLRLISRKKKKDFWEMFFHHIVTFGLLMLSYTTGYMRIGVVVYLLHNAFDPFLHLAKCTHYIKMPVVPDLSFACCAICFAASRLYFYPLSIWAAWQGVCVGNKTCPGGVWDKTPVEYTLIALLSALLPIHCLWFYMILRVIKNSFISKSGVQGDVRSDSEDDDEEPPSSQRPGAKKRN